MTRFSKLFPNEKPVIGMVHLAALPGAPGYGGDLAEVFARAESDLRALLAGGIDAVIVENFGDVPYAPKGEAMTYAAMTGIVTRLRAECPVPMGVNVQFNDCEAEWAMAYGTGCDFIRVEVLAENRMGPNGVFLAAGPQLARLRAQYPADVAVLADLQVKHTFPLVEQPLDFTVGALREAGADAVICTGLVTGASPTLDDVRRVKALAGTLPVLVGSGTSAISIAGYLGVADGAIVGSSIKEGGVVENAVDEARVRELMAAARPCD